MRNYFNNTSAMTTDNTKIQQVFRTADSEPHRFIRIRMDKTAMLLDYKGCREYKILDAKVFTWPSNHQLRVIDFASELTNYYFYDRKCFDCGSHRCPRGEHSPYKYSSFGSIVRLKGIRNSLIQEKRMIRECSAFSRRSAVPF